MNWPSNKKVLALCGGVGGAKLALGLSKLLSPGQLNIVVNTGDDFEHFGLPVCPDLDTVTYTLAGLNNPDTGWGRKGETWQCFETLEQLGAETWFRLGDKDLAIHLTRRELLAGGNKLSEATARIAARLGIEHAIIPMSDESVRTRVETVDGELSFQHYFVREQCKPAVTGFYFSGAEKSKPSPGFSDALADPDLAAVLICPSNPFVSVAPIFSIPGVRDKLRESSAPLIAVSPIVGGQAIKGPAAKMMTELGMDLSARGVFNHYGDLLDGFVIDRRDRELMGDFPDPKRVHCCNTVMDSLQDRIDLAQQCLRFATQLGMQPDLSSTMPSDELN